MKGKKTGGHKRTQLKGQIKKGAFLRAFIPAVTYGHFAKLALRRGWTAAFLADRFRGKIEEPRAFFERVLACRSNGEDLSASLIPYRSVLEFYQRELSSAMPAGTTRGCECGCGKPVHGRKKLASAACRKRMERRRSRIIKSGSEKHKKDGAFSVTF